MIKCSLLFSLTLLLLNISSQATEFMVGGQEYGWKVPPSSAKDSLNQWAAKNRFLIGDILVWKYNASRDSVLEVTRESYQSCNRTSPLADHKVVAGSGATVVKLVRSGPYYFIGGAAGACEQGEKLIVVVLSEKHSVHARLAPASSPAESSGPAPAPTSGASEVAGRKGGGIIVAGAALLALRTLLLISI